MEATRDISLEDEAGLAQSIEMGQRVKLGGQVDVGALWGNYETHLSVVLRFPDKTRQCFDIDIVDSKGKLHITKAQAAQDAARCCLKLLCEKV